jgi:hypothetical protein
VKPMSTFLESLFWTTASVAIMFTAIRCWKKFEWECEELLVLPRMMFNCFRCWGSAPIFYNHISVLVTSFQLFTWQQRTLQELLTVQYIFPSYFYAPYSTTVISSLSDASYDCIN